jgi:hypothetical protein
VTISAALIAAGKAVAQRNWFRRVMAGEDAPPHYSSDADGRSLLFGQVGKALPGGVAQRAGFTFHLRRRSRSGRTRSFGPAP